MTAIHVLPKTPTLIKFGTGSKVSSRAVNLLAILYLVFSISSSICYVYLLLPHISNDFWWPNFNSSGVQTFLGDIYHARLALTPKAQLDLFGVGMLKDYSGANSVMNLSPSIARFVLLNNLPLRDAILAMRANTLAVNFRMLVQYCWVDFYRKYEMAHTTKRQSRCLINDVDNGAVYLEALLRNVPSDDNEKSEHYKMLHSTVFVPLQEFPMGAQWVRDISSHEWLEVSEEIKLLQSFGLSRWQTQLQNLRDPQIDESITIVNALGLAQAIKINKRPQMSRGMNEWTTAYGYAGFWNDLIWGFQQKFSLLLNSNSSATAKGIDWDRDLNVGPDITPTLALFRQYFGPYESVDLYLVAYPIELVDFYVQFENSLIDGLESLKAINVLSSQGAVIVDPTPPSWQGIAAFYGGNPFCVYGDSLPYVQESFGYYDACGSQDPLTIQLDIPGSLFSLTALGALSTDPSLISSYCKICQTQSLIEQCSILLASSRSIWATYLPNLYLSVNDLIRPALLASARINISIIQFASQNNQDVVLTQEMLPLKQPDQWTFFGWITIYEWLRGLREVYRFDGDISSVAIMSRRHELVAFRANSLEVPQSAGRYLLGISLYVTIIMSFVVGVMIIFALSFPFRARNVILYNRVAGFIWVGRPFLAVRGLTALALLCTSEIEFVLENGISKFVYPRRSIFATMVIAGEATWVAYVFQDIILPFTKKIALRYSTLASIFTWCIIVVWEIIAPYKATATIDQQCKILSLGLAVDCSSGTIQVGDFNRLSILFVVNISSVLLVGGMAYFMKSWSKMAASYPSPHFAVPAPSEAFFEVDSDEWYLDSVACVMSGVIPFGKYLFDIKLWVIATRAQTIRGHTFRASPSSVCIPCKTDLMSDKCVSVISTSSVRAKIVTLLGFAYICCTVAISYQYVGITKSTMSNDFWWATFNNTAGQPYLHNWFTVQLQLLPQSDVLTLDLTDQSHGDLSHFYNLTYPTKVGVSSLYASKIQDEANTLTNVIRSLRKMSAHQIPWIFTAYCYVDFEKTWEMANSRLRQERCLKTHENGAIYLESFLRNTNWNELFDSWGASFESAILNYLRTTQNGINWIDRTKSNQYTASQEEDFWIHHGIKQYTTQWQNYKRLGVIETFSIQNAMGVSYQLTLKFANSTSQIPSETSFRMYWGLANDLWAVTPNQTSSISGRSLIRSSPNYAFSNLTIASILIENGTLSTPFGLGFSNIESNIGPFGSISMYRVICPREVLQWYKEIRGRLLALLTGNVSAQAEYSPLSAHGYILVRPRAWNESTTRYFGGNMMCDSQSSSAPGLLNFFSVEGSCMVGMADSLNLNVDRLVVAYLATSTIDQNGTPVWQNIHDMCVNSMLDIVPILKLLSSVEKFIKKFVQVDIFQASRKFSDLARKTIFEKLPPLEIIQHLRMNMTKPTFGRARLLDPDEPEFEFVSWMYIIDWTMGLREVVTFQGDIGNVTTISGYTEASLVLANPQEIPLNVAIYIRSVIIYVTFVLGIVAALVSIYILALRGRVEGMNLFVFNRVAGQVWIGRPILMVRAVTAICHLSTARLELVQFGDAFKFVSPNVNLLNVWMASGELTWLVYILNDTFSLITQEYMYRYSMKSSLLVWTVVFAWNLWQPAEHVVNLARTCIVDEVDFQAVCDGGSVQIGSIRRVLLLIGLTCAICVVCYGYEVITRPNLNRYQESSSALLHGAAKFGFMKKKWMFQKIYYLDKASGVMTGVLSFEWQEVLYVFDIKTWRIHIFEISDYRDSLRTHSISQDFLSAIPMIQ